MAKIARIASYLFHPLLMPTYGFLLLVNSGYYFSLMTFEAKRFIVLIVFLSTFAMPLLSIGLMMLGSKFKLNLDKGSDRIFPLLSTAAFYYMGYYFLGKIPIYPIYRIVLIASILTIALLLLISTKWKISAHMAGLGGLIGAFIALSVQMHLNASVILIGLILAAGITATSRMILHKHTPSQIYAGFMLGFVVNYSILAIL